MRHDELSEVSCSVARTWAVLGERWTMLVLRECFRGQTRFEEFSAKLGLGRNVLSDRLTKLADEGVLELVQYQTKPVRHEYLLTPKGEELYPALLAMMQWGDQYKSDRPPVRLVHRDCGHDPLPLNTCAHCGQTFHRQDLRATFEPGAW